MLNEYLKFYLGSKVLLIGDEVTHLNIMSLKFFDSKTDKIALRRFESLSEDELSCIQKFESESDSSDEQKIHIACFAFIIKNLCELGVDVFCLIDKGLAIDYDTLRK